MKFSRTATLALALAAGVAGTALAQTAATPKPTGNPAGTPFTPDRSPAQQAQLNNKLMTPGAAQPGTAPATAAANPNATMPPAASQSVAGANPEVRSAQQDLRAAGLYNGQADGVMDPDTRAALANFQDRHGLRRTESLDAQTLAALNANQTSRFGSSAPPSAGMSPPSAGSEGMTTTPSGPAGTPSTGGTTPRPY